MSCMKYHTKSKFFLHLALSRILKIQMNQKWVIFNYLDRGLVEPNDAYVIAVNSCQLRNWQFPTLYGISQFPFAVETVFRVDPYQLRLDRNTLEIVERGHQHRPYIINKNDAQVPTYVFLDPRLRHISAIWAVDFNGKTEIGGSDQMVVVHNPNAINPIPIGFLPAENEYVATPSGSDKFILRKVAPKYKLWLKNWVKYPVTQASVNAHQITSIYGRNSILTKIQEKK